MEPKVKDQILHRLKRQGPQTANALAEHLHVSPMAVRQHLQALRANRWVTYREERRPMGRPVKLWQLTEQAAELFPNSHADLTVDLLETMRRVLGPKGLAQLLAERTRRQIQAYAARLETLTGRDHWRDRVEAIAQIRTQEGYMAEVIVLADDCVLLVENHCPICAAAQTCQQFCGSELEVFQALLGSTVTIERVEHIIQGDRRCAYRIQPQI